VIVGWLLMLQASAPAVSGPAVSGPVPAAAPRVSLEQAIARATRLDPNYVQALGLVDNAEWGRRAALAVFVLPSITASIDATKYSTEFFNIGTGRNQAEAVNATLEGRYDLFSGQKFTRSEERRVGKECRSRWSPYH